MKVSGKTLIVDYIKTTQQLSSIKDKLATIESERKRIESALQKLEDKLATNPSSLELNEINVVEVDGKHYIVILNDNRIPSIKPINIISNKS